MKYLVVFLIGLLLLLQFRLWRGDGSLAQVHHLRQEISIEQEKVTTLKERNQTLEAEVQDLKNRLGALEERARSDLGMIRKNETFFQHSASSQEIPTADDLRRG
ncbi:septum formation initiator family protein [Candidatus Berkiella aquae]|uniref:Cell division protein FtsB n=1 Tax=Candidatus Berkiella aquae TaxID=295108 RepID=A0A0Q9YKE1_9GAMM|nr:septum formation initiator family protein [Candidatus Berkiella aquae]MCS5711190.1 septum formation initiator family protein [Candidatus Berkiella aquae]